MVNNPSFVKQVLVSNSRNYNKDTYLNKVMLQSVTGQGLLTSENPLWRKQRRLIQPAFHRNALSSFATLIVDAANLMLERWHAHANQNERFDIAEEFMSLTLDIVTRALFGYNISSESAKVGEAVSTLIEIAKPKRRRFKETLKVLDEIVYRIIDQRRRFPNDDQTDLLDMLLHSRYEGSSEGMGDRQIRDEVMSLLIAGHETTANTLSWMAYLLCQHADVVGRLEAEAAKVLDDRSPALADFPSLPYTNQVVKESMRLFPSAWSISRRSLADDEIGGYHIPARSIVALSPYALHRHQDFWPEPDRFDPGRFAAENEGSRPRYAYIPFGGGPRKCIGDQFAMMESMIILPMIVQRFRLQLVANHPVEGHAIVTLRPKYGIMVTASART